MTRLLKPRKIVNVYIDGYNFYESINNDRLLRLGWCNFSKLAERLASRAFNNRYEIGTVKYYTSEVTEPTKKRDGEVERQRIWLGALKHGTNVWVVHGKFKKRGSRPRVEKRTDTNIAIGMVRDALVPHAIAKRTVNPGRDVPSPCDAVILLSGDEDLVPAVEMIANEYGKEVAVYWPLDAPSPSPVAGLIRVDRLTIDDLERSRLPDEIARPSGPPITWTEYLEMRRTRS